MIEYTNDTVVKFFKQYEMFSKTLNYTDDFQQKNDICNQMTRIIEEIIKITTESYEKKYTQVMSRKVYLMDEEKNRLQELINLINERKTYITNQINTNYDLTGIFIETPAILGEDKIDTYKREVKVIDKYKSNLKEEEVLKNEIKELEISIKKANSKVNNNVALNKQLEEKMISILEDAFNKLGLYELKDYEKDIELSYTELGYSLEMAKQNAIVARNAENDEIKRECDRMLVNITTEYEKCKEKKLILKLIYIYKNQTNNYSELLEKRETINNILVNITNSELYKLVGIELNKQYATIKLEKQDMQNVKSLIEEKELKISKLNEINIENDSDEFKTLLANLLENERKYQEHLRQQERKKELERLEKERLIEQEKQKELAIKQKELEEERKKEIERRTRELLIEKKNPILMSNKNENKEIKIEPPKKMFVDDKREEQIRIEKDKSFYPDSYGKTEVEEKTIDIEKKKPIYSPERPAKDVIKGEMFANNNDDFFSRKRSNITVPKDSIPVIKNTRSENIVVDKVDKKESLFPDIPLEKKDNIFPDIKDIKSSNSFFDESEFKDLSNYIEDDKKSWF